jgi:hypothetical protein
MERDTLSESLSAAAVQVDPLTLAFYLRVPRAQVVLLQAYFELYDGVGSVRTLTGDEPVVCVMTGNSLKEDCIGVLKAIREDVEWEVFEGAVGG